jgi:P pilus assembly chaperone PapD
MSKTVLVCFVFLGLLSILFPASARASIELSPTSLSFGNVALNTVSSAATVVITNNGRQKISIEEITSSLPEFVLSGISLPLTISPQSSTSFSVVFLPKATQAYTGSVSVVGHNRCIGTIYVSGAGIAAAPAATYVLSSSASNLAFGSTLVGTSASRSITLTNMGTGTVSVSQVSVSSAAFAFSGFSGAVTLGAGQSLPFTVSFTPSAPVSATGNLTVISNATNSPATIALSGTGVQSQISVTPSSVGFGSVTTGTTNTQTLTISNPGTANLTVMKATMSGTDFAYSGLTLPLTIAPGASSSCAVSFAPTTSGIRSGTLTLANNSGTPSMAVSVTGTGVAQALQLSASPTSLSFGSLFTGSSTTKVVTLTNSGSGSLSLSGDAVTGTGFTVGGLTFPLTLAANQSTSFSVTFDPTVVGSATGSVTVISNATNSPATIALSGTGVQSQISVTPSSVGFGSVTTGTTNMQTLTISNPGTANLTVTQASLSGAGFASSGLTPPLTIAPGSSSTFMVSFAPSTAGTFSGTLTLANNSPTTSLTVPLTGTGIAQVLQLFASPTSLNFGSVTMGANATHAVTINNTGNANVTLSQDSVTGSGFAVTGLTLPLTLASGQSTSFTVAFAPTATGSVSGSVIVTSNATNSPNTISLSGTGSSPATYKAVLTWTASSSSYSGFHVYRSTVSGGPYTKIDTSLIPTPTYTDSTIASGQTYYYVTTEVGASGTESAYSTQTSATIP